MLIRFHSFSQVVKWPEFVRLYTTNILQIQCQISLTDRGPLYLREVLGSLPTGMSVLQHCFTFQCAFYQAKPIILEKTLNQNYYFHTLCLSVALGADRSRVLRLEKLACDERGNRCAVWYSTLLTFSFKGGPEPSKQIIQKVLFPIGRFHF